MPETRKQIDPSASGRQTSDAPISADSVLTLKNRVPGNWMAAAHQSLHAGLRQRPCACRPLRNHCVNEAAVKHSDPTK